MYREPGFINPGQQIAKMSVNALGMASSAKDITKFKMVFSVLIDMPLGLGFQIYRVLAAPTS